ncbi:MAG: hypothetical protein WA705_30810 [Candidatus Ozemobacteraceae bacterium]
MRVEVTPELIELAFNALLTSYWRKPAVTKFLRSCGVAERDVIFLNPQETKRQSLDRLFPKLQETDCGLGIIARIALELSQKRTFQDLEDWEDKDLKIERAKRAVSCLNEHLATQENRQKKEEVRASEQQEQHTIAIHIAKAVNDLDKLRTRLDELLTRLGTQQAGYDFQDWFYEMMDYNDIDNRRPFNHDGRQIDGSITVADATYIVELKFTAQQSGAAVIDSLLAKVNTKADNTMGVMVSVSGYSGPAVKGASFARTPILLMEFNHLNLQLVGGLSFQEIISRLRRHASQTGEAFLSASHLTG